MAKPKIKFVPDSLHVKKGDTVMVIIGRSKDEIENPGDKGKIGKVLKVFPKRGKIVVENVNVVKKHMKPTAANQKGGIVEREAPIFSSKVMLYDEHVGKPTRVGYKTVEGKRVRYSKKSGEIL
ncbi:MAG: 50S ribosomal protein L24 [Fusobacteriaceae bacterium]|jgi:large subunit ribosomal protein L24|nr:50S ribosomal protein L24 [Fusobacteriaceae bacterium]